MADTYTASTGMAVVCSSLANELSRWFRVIYFGRFGQPREFAPETTLPPGVKFEYVPTIGGVWDRELVVRILKHYDEVDYVFSEDDFFSAHGLVGACNFWDKPFHFLTPIDSLPVSPMAFPDIFTHCDKVYVPNSSYETFNGKKRLVQRSGRTINRAGSNIKAVHLPHGVDTNKFFPIQTDRADEFTFLWIGRLEERKAPGRAILAFEKIYDKMDAVMYIRTDWNTPNGKRFYTYLRRKNLPVILDQTADVPHHEMNKVYNKADVNLCTAKAGGFEMCVLPSTLVVTGTGISRIDKIYKGEKALNNIGMLKPIDKVSNRKHDGELYTITTYGDNTPVSFTPEHPIYIRRRIGKENNKLVFDEPVWIPAKDACLGDCVVFPIPKGEYTDVVYDLADFDSSLVYNDEFVWYKTGRSPKTGELVKYNRYIPLNNDLATLIGYYISDGSMNKNQKTATYFCFNSDEEEYIVEVKDIVSRLFGLSGFTDIKYKNRGGKTVIVSGKALGIFLSTLCGHGSHYKKIPMELLYNTDLTMLHCFINAAMNGDGYYEPSNHRMCYTTVSSELGRQVWISALRLGYKPVFSTQSQSGFSDGTHVLVSYSLKKNTRNRGTRTWIDGERFLMLIKKIEKSMYNGLVYDLTVPDGNSFIASHFIVHNSVTESAACGIPSIVTDWTFMNENVVDGKSGFLVPTESFCHPPPSHNPMAKDRIWGNISVDKLAETMLYTYNNQEEVRAMGRWAKDYVTEAYDWTRIAEKLKDEILEKVE